MRAYPSRLRIEPRTYRRLLQVLLSLVAALVVLFALDVPKLIDEMPRVLVSRTMQRPVSGDIVLVTTERSKGEIDTVAAREAKAIAALDAMKPERIVFEGRFPADDPGIPALRQSIDAAKVPVIVAWPAAAGDLNAQDSLTVSRNASLPVDGEAVDANWTSLTGYVFEADYAFEADGKQFPRLGAAIAGKTKAPGNPYPIDFRYAPQTIPVITLDDLEQGRVKSAAVSGKRLVVAAPASGSQSLVNTPLRKSMPSTIVGAIAAETLLSGSLQPVDWFLPFLAFGLALALAAALPKQPRRFSYAVLSIASLAAPFVAARFDLLLPTGMVYTLLGIYAAVRIRNNWRERAASVDATSGLSNFNALLDDFPKSRGRLVIARVENFEEILASLEPSLHRSFIQQISQRLSVGNEVRIYTDTTGHFAWFDEMEHAKSHITGLLALASAPLRVSDRTLDFSCAFGILDNDVAKPRQAISATIVAAELASKRPSRMALVSEQGGSDTDWQLSLHSSLDHAIAHQHIYLLFQPQCLLESGHVVGAEALVRWKHPQRGEISPTEFIPFIEKAGRLKPLTAHTLRLAARSANAALNAGARISVNISATLLAEHDFVSLICDNIAAGGGRPEAITIEITETAKIDDFRTAARNLERLQERGFHISLDDFGTGEANLSLLVGLPCDEIKIDRSFVALAQHNDRARIVIRALNDTARKAGMRLVAEGIETEDEQDLLISLGCVIGQGFLYGRPMRISELLGMLDVRENAEARKLTLY
jgi:diguanylate cyclase